MDTIFMNSKNSIAFNLHRLLLNLSEKINLKRSNKHVALSKQKSCAKAMNLKYQLQRGVMNLNYLIDQILYEIFMIILNISSKT